MSWSSFWYYLCASPLEVSTVSLVLFLQAFTLLSVLHCLPAVRHADHVFSQAVYRKYRAASEHSVSGLYVTPIGGPAQALHSTRPLGYRCCIPFLCRPSLSRTDRAPPTPGHRRQPTPETAEIEEGWQERAAENEGEDQWQGQASAWTNH